ncbi:zinc-dependent metalloprotease [Novosphingobium aerophilum]|uniref:Zinc-dependent metalloprotease n=1 Tax=Novosphingobium aerophilum TaxID=2839843 RepID=A0A7X1F5D2_9SPHN|nr:zinc-dependent metalloprotease [Novosphingobium aerophilum]MBC2650655.1 zinc-dependent metalloprotease [Novosphingobium aerophilum]
MRRTLAQGLGSLAFGLAALSVSGAALAGPAAPASAAGPYAGTEKRDGLFPVHVDKAAGRILLSLPAAGSDGVVARVLYATALRTGLGSAPIGLDRAQPGPARILLIRRLGKKVAFELENPRFRATGGTPAEQAAAADAFATSVLWLGDALDAPDGRLLVDIAPFLARDTRNVTGQLNTSGEKGWRLVDSLSAADPQAVRTFPQNLEFEARQTYVSDTPGPEVRNIAPDSRQVTLVVRHSFIALPEGGYVPRRFDPRGGSFSTQILDFSAPLGRQIVQNLANRFRLERLDPQAPQSRVRKPIVFYIDNAAPEPIRTALLEGASWWKAAFEAAGFIDAYRVEILPDGVDPLDIRYNVVNWVNRATRGWSYGYAITDPRTGEILKGTVLLGSLRVRQDILIYEGLVGADKTGRGGPNDPAKVALDRIRQLAAHEVGHALGLLHNFAGSTQDRASVMDYPAPRIGLKDGVPDLSDAYGAGLGRWDRHAIDWLYGDPAAGDPDLAARAKADRARREGLRFVSDENARSVSTSQPWGSLWDDGADPVAELDRTVQVRAAAVARFGPAALAPGEPLADLRRKFVPIWLLHRYQVEAAAKLLGGLYSQYAVSGEGRDAAAPVPPAEQGRALESLLATLAPARLEVPAGLVPQLSAGTPADDDRQTEIEIMPMAGAAAFDPLSAAQVAAQVTLDALLAPERLARLADQHRSNLASPGPDLIARRLLALLDGPVVEPRLGAIRRALGTRIVLSLARAAAAPASGDEAAAVLQQALQDWADAQPRRRFADPADRAWALSTARLVQDREGLMAMVTGGKAGLAVPPGMPIGDDAD